MKADKPASSTPSQTNTENKPGAEEEKKEEENRIQDSKGYLPRWAHWMFASFLFVGSSMGFYILFRNRSRFIVKSN